MLSQKREYQSFDTPEATLPMAHNLPEAENSAPEAPVEAVMPSRFYGHYHDCMEMYAEAKTVAEYLDNHQQWFSRSAHPMKVEPLGENAYALLIGRFGAFGYEVEPKIGLELLPPEQGVYITRTTPVPGYVAPGYEVDYRAKMQLVEVQATDSALANTKLTRVEWELDLTVDIQFPKFIHRLPKSLIQSTGDRLLNQIVRQVSRRLTHKVQEDFHESVGIPFPVKSKKR